MGKVPTVIAQAVLVILIIVLGYLVYDTLSEPVIFEKNKAAKYDDVKQRMQDIIQTQEAFKSIRGEYADDFDTLIHVVRTSDIMNVRTIGSESDTVNTLSVSQAMRLFEINPDLSEDEMMRRMERAVANYNAQLLRKTDTAAPTVRDAVVSYIVQDTFFVPAMSTIELSGPIDSLPYIPHGGGAKFEMQSNILEVGAGRVKVPTFEVIAYNKDILREENQGFYLRREGIKLGSLTEPRLDIVEITIEEE